MIYVALSSKDGLFVENVTLSITTQTGVLGGFDSTKIGVCSVPKTEDLDT